MWVVDSSYSGGETTNINFRGSNVFNKYQVDTVATLSCQEQDNVKLPMLSASILGDLTCFTVDKNLILQSSEILSFDDAIDDIEWSIDGKLIVMGLNSGTLFILNAETSDLISSVNLCSEDRHVDGRAFKKIIVSALGDLLIVTADGQLIVLPDLKIPEDGIIDEVIRNNVRMGMTKSCHSVVNDVVIVGDYVYTVGSGSYMLCKWCFRGDSIKMVDCVESEDESSLNVIKTSSDGHFLFTLDSNHHMSIWNASMMINTKTFFIEKMIDILLLESTTTQKNSLKDMKIVSISKPEDGQCHLIVKSLPDWETVYDLELSAPCFLSKCNSFQDVLFFSEFSGNNENTESLTSLKFRSLSETDPETRLYRILQKNKFDEAEKFANLFQLDMELVHKVKANFLIDELSPWKCTEHDSDKIATMVTQLWACLDTVGDGLHVAEKCMTAALPTLKDTDKLLSYCNDKHVIMITFQLQKTTCKDSSSKEKQQQLLTKLLEIQHRFITFKLIFGEDLYSGERWEQFMHVDLLSESLKWFDERRLDYGFIIWTRHQSCWQSDILCKELIQKILCTVLSDISLNDLYDYLSNAIIPCVIQETPDAMEDVVEFIINRTKTFETKDKENWPLSAIQFAKHFFRTFNDVTNVVMNDETCSVQENVHQTLLNCKDKLKSLSTLIIKLQQLDKVLHTYKFKLTLEQFLKETTETIAFRMLDKAVTLDLIHETLERQIQPYMNEYSLHQDMIFSKYVRDVLERSSKSVSYRDIAAVIDCITDVEQKIVGVLEVIKWADIPWSQGVDQIVQIGLNLKHANVKKIEEQCERVKVRKVMMKYGLKNCAIPEGDNLERLLHYMILQDKTRCMDDALIVMRYCNVNLEIDLYLHRMRQLIECEKFEESMELLETLPCKIGVKIGKRLVNYTYVTLQDTTLIEGLENKIKKNKQVFTQAAVLILKFLQSKTEVSDVFEMNELKQDEVMYKNLLALQIEFDLYLTTLQYNTDVYRMKLVDDYIDNFLNNQQDQTSSYGKLYRLARHLQIYEPTVQGKLAIKYANIGDIQTAVRICGELYESHKTVETADTLYDVVKGFIRLQAEMDIDNDDNDVIKSQLLPDVCSRLANQALCFCDPCKIPQFLELSKVCALALNVCQQCESGDTNLTDLWEDFDRGLAEKLDEPLDKELYSDLTLDVYQEDGSIMNSSIIVPLIAKYVEKNPLLTSQGKDSANNEGEKSIVQEYCEVLMPVVEYLRDNCHLQIAYNFSIHMMFTLQQYILHQDMGLPISEEQSKKVRQEWKIFQDIQKHSQAMLKDLINTIVMKIYNSSKIDCKLAYTYLCTCPKREVIDLVMRLAKTYGQQYKKLKAIAGLGIALGETFHDPGIISKCQTLEEDSSWAYRLKKMKISFKNEIFGPCSEKSKLLPAIAQNEAADSRLVIEYCQSLKLDETQGLLLYIDHLFHQPDDSTFDTDYNKLSVIARAREAISKIVDKDRLVQTLKKVYFRTSPYDYETLEFLLEMMSDVEDIQDVPVDKGLKLLEYLKVYTRQAPPAEYEIDFKMDGKQKEMFTSVLPKESKTRLPIHPLIHGDAWKIITPELKRETITTWLMMSNMLNLSADQLRLVAVQNMVRVYTDSVTSPDSGSDFSAWRWGKEQVNLTLLQDASEILQNNKNVEISLACAKWMISKLPLGSEKVFVLQHCVRMAELWHQNVPEDNPKRQKAKGAFVKFTRDLKKLSTAQILCLNNLSDTLQYIDKPSGLLQQLYEHNSITDIEWTSTSPKPDIHDVAEKIAEIHDICLDTIHKTLMEKWLQSSNPVQQDSDSTMTFNLDNLQFNGTIQENDDKDEDDNFRKIQYLVQGAKNGNNAMRLFDFALHAKEGYDTGFRINALRCILHLCDDEMILNVCNKSVQDIRDLLRITIYLSRLEMLHIQHTVDTFMSCNKTGLVKGIWKHHSHNKTAITIVSCLCLDYQIYDLQLWGNILSRLLSFDLLEQLESVLLRLNTVPELWQVSSFNKVWYSIIASHLQKVSAPLNDEATMSCIHYFNVLLSCPVLKYIDCVSLSKMYKELELPACALGCLLICKDLDDTLIQEMIRQRQTSVLENARYLLNFGLNKRISLKVQHTVYRALLDEERFDIIQSDIDQRQFLMYCVEIRNIDTILAFAIKQQRVQQAKTIIKVYMSSVPNVLTEIQDYIDENEEDQDIAILKAYLEMQGMTKYLSMV
ncbi:Kinetochore-associated protein 1 [Mactra antiquata]